MAESLKSPPTKRSRLVIMTTTICQIPDGVIGISLAMLGGNGHFQYGPLACKMFLRESELIPHFKKITTG